MSTSTYLKRQAREAVAMYFRPMRVLWRLLTSVSCEEMEPDEEGWPDWIHPLPGYLMKCCDCGLVHEMQVAITKNHSAISVSNDGEDDDHVVVFRMRRS